MLNRFFCCQRKAAWIQFQICTSLDPLNASLFSEEIQGFLQKKEYIILTLFHRYVNSQHKHQVYLNIDPFSSRPFIITNKRKLQNCITISQFVDMLARRWEEEQKYLEGVADFKEKIAKYYAILFSDKMNNTVIEVFKIQLKQIMDTLDIQINYDKIQEAKQFCQSLLNGFETEPLQNFEYVADYVFYKNLIVPQFKNLLDFIQSKNKELVLDEVIQGKREEISIEVLKFINDFLKTDIFIIKKGKSTKERINELENLTQTGKGCKLVLGSNFDLLSIISNQNKMKIESIKIFCTVKEYNENQMIAPFEELELTSSLDKKNIKTFATKIPRTLKLLKLHFAGIIFHEVEHLTPSLAKLTLLKEMDLNFCYSSLGTDGMIIFAKSLKELKSLNNLCLNFCGNTIENEGTEALAASLKELKLLVDLKLNLNYNGIGNEGLKGLALSFKEMEFISDLNLSFIGNNIGDDGAVSLALSLKALPKLKKLELNLRCDITKYKAAFNTVGAPGANAINNLKKINPRLQISLEYQLQISFG